ncbi:hypothetical protein SAMN04489752_1781 [Brevibacterium siliguriense]|uniref:Uncharacterized protein n=1 Tax=Brevibacterium siliguriense TaxID=1136497 RepID=A0A1H1SFS3_9MICO|nr:hypothetical protein [Brevibacterium siliguriense]SDS46802.1 hypothetical protein SAMN04489752_1781 [Brevibacterium siliguriense]
MGTFAIIPAAPVLLEDIDRIETTRMVELRTAIRDTVRTQAEWALPIEVLPPVAGLGGWGIDRGVDTRTGRLLTGSDWGETVEALTPEERRLAEAADPAIIVAILHAHAAGVDIGTLGTSENLLLPIDLSGAATEDAPLAPVDGAADFDAAVIEALTSGPTMDTERLFEFCDRADSVAANLSALAAGIRYAVSRSARVSTLEPIVDEPVHEVRTLCGTGTWQ